jgi:hypothetical protein
MAVDYSKWSYVKYNTIFYSQALQIFNKFGIFGSKKNSSGNPD